MAPISSLQILLFENSIIRALKNIGTSLQYSPRTTLSGASTHQQRHTWVASAKQWVKSTKLHVRRTVGETVLTFEELTTLLTQIEAILN